MKFEKIKKLIEKTGPIPSNKKNHFGKIIKKV